jgi:DNA-binding ferritin-like protein
MIDRLIARVFATRNATHLAHWKTKSYSEHMALGELYEALIESLDEIVEAYQGAKGLVSVAFEAPKPADDIRAHLEAEAAWIAKNRMEIAGSVQSVANLVDELHATYLTAIYKLKHLK